MPCRVVTMRTAGMASTAGKQAIKVTQAHITREEAGQRIDNFLARRLKGVPRSLIYRILRRGEVRVNSGRIRPGYKLEVGDIVRIPPVRVAPDKRNTLSVKGLSWVEKSVLFENSRLLVINKPSGVAAHGGSGISHGVIEAIRAVRADAPGLELVHRLDRDTSGCLIIAKRRSALRGLHGQLREGVMNKRYLALVKGQWTAGTRTVRAALRKNRLQSGERIVRVDDEGKEAETIFHPVSGHGMASLVDIELKTGRTHQIRVHAAHIGCPLAGDGKYGDPAFNRALKSCGLRRLFLHAHMIEFTDPGNNEVINVSAPLGDDLKQVLDNLDRESHD